MKCKDCPMFDCYRDSYEYDEYDIRCLSEYIKDWIHIHLVEKEMEE